MKKMRLPKPVETRVHYNDRYVGSVYTAKQMHKFAEKAVLLEREACITELERNADKTLDDIIAAIRARGQA